MPRPGNTWDFRRPARSCHLADFQKTINPNHVAAKFSTTCETCHTTFDTWLNASFDHSTTGFLLTNGHANVPCASCHINNNYNLVIAPTDCGNSQCHLTTWQQTTNPVHPSAGAAFAAANCTTCHNTVSWTTATFDHSTTGFPLTNGHANVACTSCHINNNYTLTIAPTDCGNSQCHLTTWQQTNNPVHSTSGTAFAAANCAVCHSTVSWTTAIFDHSTTGFALTGTHMSPTPTPCVSCHVSNNYTLNSTDCYGCHQAAFLSTTTIGGSVPNHVTAGFPTTASACATCHPITTWSAGVFDHTATGFPLTNGHAGRGLRFVPHQQQLRVDDCANRLRKFAMPFDHLAANNHAGALHIGIGICGGKLRHLPHDNGMGRGVVRSQRYRIYVDRHAHVPDADALRLLPYQQQLQPEFDGLLWMPPGGLREHDNDWRKRSEPCDGGIPHYGFGLRHVPPDYDLVGGSV